MRPQLSSSDNCQNLHNLNDWITREIKIVKTKRDKQFHLWMQATSGPKKDLHKNKGSKLHRLLKMPSEIVFV